MLEVQGHSVSLINLRFIKPIDSSAIIEWQRMSLYALEDHVLHNGFGAAIIELLHDAGINTPVVRIGWPDEFIEHGNIPALREKHGLTPENAIQLIMENSKLKTLKIYLTFLIRDKGIMEVFSV